jgi:hypothetical protein
MTMSTGRNSICFNFDGGATVPISTLFSLFRVSEKRRRRNGSVAILLAKWRGESTHQRITQSPLHCAGIGTRKRLVHIVHATTSMFVSGAKVPLTPKLSTMLL